MAHGNLNETLRQMLALLEGERQALAGLDLERILLCAEGKTSLCNNIESLAQHPLDEECRGLMESVRRLNALNRQMRNLIAANVESRIESLSGRAAIYARNRVTIRSSLSA